MTKFKTQTIFHSWMKARDDIAYLGCVIYEIFLEFENDEWEVKE